MQYLRRIRLVLILFLINREIRKTKQSAEIAEGYRELFDQANDLKRIQQDMARMMELSAVFGMDVYRKG